MVASASASPSPSSTPQSRLFLPPGRPRSLATRLAIRNRIMHRLRGFLSDHGFQEVPSTGADALALLDGMLDEGFPALWCESQGREVDAEHEEGHLPRYRLVSVRSCRLDLEGVGTLMADLLRDITGCMGVEMLGGRQVTRLDRALQGELPRLRYDDAVATASQRGWDLTPGQDLAPAVEASLVRHCGNLPILVTHWPSGLKAGLRPVPGGRSERVKCLVPYAGEIMDGGVYDHEDGRAGFSLGVNRLMQYLMGLGSVSQTRIVPFTMDRPGHSASARG